MKTKYFSNLFANQYFDMKIASKETQKANGITQRRNGQHL